MKHTKGEWENNGNLVLGDGKVIASFFYSESDDPYSPTRNECMANIKLVKGAPALLEALEEIISAYENDEVRGEQILQGRRAIKKATE